MGTVEVEIEPDEVGMSAERLERIGTHLHRYVDAGFLPGTLVSVSRGGRVVYVDAYGHREIESSAPVEIDTIYRIYSMTKPLTTIAAMQLYEQGLLALTDPVSRFIPSFSDTRVWTGGSAEDPQTRPAAREITIHDLMTHTSGLTYGFLHVHPVDAMYRAAGMDLGTSPGDLETTVDTIASLPLLFDPGTEWNYSMATDVLGRVVEVVSGRGLDDYLGAEIIDPLGMEDTAFHVPESKVARFAANYFPKPPDKRAALYDPVATSAFVSPPTWLSGGGGLVSTLHDYHRFTSMLRGGGALDGARIIGRRTLEYMTLNHLPGGADLSEVGRPIFSEARYEGVGFGLGFSVVVNPAKAEVTCSPGEFAWGGAASTAFWVDPVEDITVEFMTQLLPSSTHPIRPELKALVYQSLVD